jgi:hypothetical protein
MWRTLLRPLKPPKVQCQPFNQPQDKAAQAALQYYETQTIRCFLLRFYFRHDAVFCWLDSRHTCTITHNNLLTRFGGFFCARMVCALRVFLRLLNLTVVRSTSHHVILVAHAWQYPEQRGVGSCSMAYFTALPNAAEPLWQYPEQLGVAINPDHGQVQMF